LATRVEAIRMRQMSNPNQTETAGEPASGRNQQQKAKPIGDGHDRTGEEQGKKSSKYNPKKKLRRVVE
jgi:hypothetical protein